VQPADSDDSAALFRLVARNGMGDALPAIVPTYCRALLCLVALLIPGEGAAKPSRPESAPWRLRDAAGAPAWLEFGVVYRLRLEQLETNYRAASADDVTALMMCSLLNARASFAPAFVAVELQDARAYLADTPPLDTTSVNVLEILEGHIGLQRTSLFATGDVLDARLGRITMDVGSRRLVARNQYRNAINGFTGVDAQWTSPALHRLRAFAVVPVTRLPQKAEAIADNQIAVDQEDTDALFWGGFYSSPALLGPARVEMFVFGLHESDGDLATRNRRLLTPGLRIHAEPAPGQLDFQAEGAYQVGTSRATTAVDDTRDLDHRAFFGRAELGWSLQAPWSPRVVGQYDYASGDGDPDDGSNGRFDTLFGARRFDFGPTGIYGPFARTNISSPGARLEVAPSQAFDGFAAYRLYWLASARDAWTTAGLQDSTGRSGSFIGQQAEVRIRWHAIPKNLDLEVGAAHLLRGGFAVEAPDGRQGPSTLAYVQVTGTI
jgi:hypothetical protein